jgi:hypothetical protein
VVAAVFFANDMAAAGLGYSDGSVVAMAKIRPPLSVRQSRIFDTNKYANNPKTDFLNWSVLNAGTFDFGSDAWSTTYGAAAEWYQGIFAFRAGVFDMSATPAGALSPLGYELDSTFGQQEFVGEIEERHQLWGQLGETAALFQ